MGDSRSQGAFVGFAPGDAVALVGQRTVALLGADPRSTLVTDLREAIRSDADLDLLTAILVGAGLRSLPSLALVQFEGNEARSILRGDMLLTVHRTSGAAPEDVSGGEVLTWVEHVATEAESLDIRREGETAELSVYEITGGVIPAARLEVHLTESSSRTRTTPPGGEEANDPGGGPSGNETARYHDMRASVEAGTPVEAPPLAGEGLSGGHDESPVEVDVDAEPAATALDDDPGHERPDTEHVDDPRQVQQASDPEQVADRDQVESPVPRYVLESHDPDSTILPGQSGGVSAADRTQPPEQEDEGTGAGASDTDAEATGASEPVAGSDADDDYDHLFGATEHRPVAQAGVDEDAADPAGSNSSDGLISSIPGVGTSVPGGGAPSVVAGAGPTVLGDLGASGVDVGDHDGMTISLAQLRATRGAGDQTLDPLARPPVDRSKDEVVHAVSCPSGHLNPPAAASCRVCGVEIAAQEHVSVPRPVLGVLRFSNGDEYPLSRSMLMGRSPKASGTSQGSQLPELITLESPSKELSGTHLEIRLEGWQVLAIDRRSTNGTTVALPGRDPQRLHPGNAVPIVPGTVIDMAEEIQFTYEVTP